LGGLGSRDGGGVGDVVGEKQEGIWERGPFEGRNQDATERKKKKRSSPSEQDPKEMTKAEKVDGVADIWWRGKREENQVDYAGEKFGIKHVAE